MQAVPGNTDFLGRLANLGERSPRLFLAGFGERDEQRHRCAGFEERLLHPGGSLGMQLRLAAAQILQQTADGLRLLSVRPHAPPRHAEVVFRSGRKLLRNRGLLRRRFGVRIGQFDSFRHVLQRTGELHLQPEFFLDSLANCPFNGLAAFQTGAGQTDFQHPRADQHPLEAANRFLRLHAVLVGLDSAAVGLNPCDDFVRGDDMIDEIGLSVPFPVFAEFAFQLVRQPPDTRVVQRAAVPGDQHPVFDRKLFAVPGERL